jgi:hypothetical protein
LEELVSYLTDELVSSFQTSTLVPLEMEDTLASQQQQQQQQHQQLQLQLQTEIESQNHYDPFHNTKSFVE